MYMYDYFTDTLYEEVADCVSTAQPGFRQILSLFVMRGTGRTYVDTHCWHLCIHKKFRAVNLQVVILYYWNMLNMQNMFSVFSVYMLDCHRSYGKHKYAEKNHGKLTSVSLSF